MYTVHNFKTKKALKEAVKNGEPVQVYNPGITFAPTPTEGSICIEGPHFPKPHKWYASAVLKNGLVVKVS